MRFEVFTAMKMPMLIFWVVTPCELVGRYQRFGGTYCLHLEGYIQINTKTKRRKTNIDK
jgi:hypothetical protein